MFNKKSYINYDEDDKGNKKIKKYLLIALAIIVSIIVVSLALTDIGLFPGNILNRFAVSSFLNNNYGNYDTEIVCYSGYDDKDDCYNYKCIVNNEECIISAHNFSVIYDGYYDYFCRNIYFQGLVRDYMNNYLEEKWKETCTDYTSKWNCLIDIPLEDKRFPSNDTGEEISDELILEACRLYGGTFNFTVEIYGESLDMEQYRHVVYIPVSMLQKEMNNRPNQMQVFYYRNTSKEPVLQFESTINTYQFDYNEIGISQSSDMHKYVEVPEDIQRNYNIYYITKTIFVIFLSVTVVALSIIWCVRKYKNNKKYKTPFPDEQIKEDIIEGNNKNEE